MNTALNYQPEVLVDTADLSREDWLDYRRLGIGGSDAAAIMGLSPFSTIRDLYFDKIGVTPVIEEEEENWVAKEVGHRLEDLVAMIFAKKTGLEVFPVRKMFRHGTDWTCRKANGREYRKWRCNYDAHGIGAFW